MKIVVFSKGKQEFSKGGWGVCMGSEVDGLWESLGREIVISYLISFL